MKSQTLTQHISLKMKCDSYPGGIEALWFCQEVNATIPRAIKPC